MILIFAIITLIVCLGIGYLIYTPRQCCKCGKELDKGSEFEGLAGYYCGECYAGFIKQSLIDELKED